MPTPTDIEIFRTVVYAFAGVIVAALFAFAVVGGIAFSKVERGAGKSFGFMFSRGNFLRISTVVFCVFAVVVLAFADKLSEGAVAVLSGISGFVLGGVSKDSTSPPSSENDNS
jgi:L-asparagine transporter-like permease